MALNIPLSVTQSLYGNLVHLFCGSFCFFKERYYLSKLTIGSRCLIIPQIPLILHFWWFYCGPFNPLEFSFTILSYLFTKCVSLWYKALYKFLRQYFFYIQFIPWYKKNRSFLIYCYIFHLSQRKFSESSNMGSTNYGGWVGKYGDDYSSDPTFHLVMVKVWLKNESFFFCFFMYYILTTKSHETFR